MRPDPVIDEVRRVRREISAEYGNDPARMLEYYEELQARLKDRLVDYGGGERRPAAGPLAKAHPEPE